MGRQDVREKEALRSLKDAQSKRDQAARILSTTPRDADRGRDDANRAASLLRDAERLAVSAVTSAEAYKDGAQTREARSLYEQAQRFKDQFDGTSTILEALANPRSSANQKKLATTLKEKGQAIAADQIQNELMTRLAQYATAHAVDGLITVLSNVPINSTTVRWAGGAVSEGLEYARGKWRRASTGVADDGTCDSRRQCHNCRANASDGGMRTCQNLYR